MLKLNSKPLPKRAQRHLNKVQQEINEGKYSTSDTDPWESRTKNKAFEEIKLLLSEMTVGDGYCNYCEQNQASTIDHIHPKAIYPYLTFVWENYLYTCPNCNTGKGSKTAVFESLESSNVIEVNTVRSPKQDEDFVFINPRIDDPLEFIKLDIRKGIFSEKGDKGTRQYERANYTIMVLNLNVGLDKKRIESVNYFFQKLNYAVKVFNAASNQDLIDAINDHEPFIDVDVNVDFEVNKLNFLAEIKKAIQNAPHATVWQEIKLQSKESKRFKKLFEDFPQALNW